MHACVAVVHRHEFDMNDVFTPKYYRLYIHIFKRVNDKRKLILVQASTVPSPRCRAACNKVHQPTQCVGDGASDDEDGRGQRWGGD